jgi:peptide deformylase
MPDDGDEMLAGDSTGLLIGIGLAAVVTGACAAVVLCRLRSRRRKSKYIAFGNPSYSREHLPANDLRMDRPLSLSSNGYTVLA